MMAEEIEEEKNGPIEIRLEQDVYDSLIGIFVMQHLSKESLSVFNDYLQVGDSVTVSLSHAVINEMANIALRAELENGTFAETVKELQNKEEE